MLALDIMKRTDKQVIEAIETLQKKGEPTTRENIARFVGVTDRHISRITSQLQKAGIIEKQQSGQQGNRYTLCTTPTGVKE